LPGSPIDGLRPQVHRAQRGHAIHRRIVAGDADNPVEDVRRRRLAEQQRVVLEGEHDGHADEHDADGDRRHRVPDGVSGDVREHQAAGGQDDREERRGVLQHDGEDGGIAVLRHVLPSSAARTATRDSSMRSRAASPVPPGAGDAPRRPV
jgi:hypothetical protein